MIFNCISKEDPEVFNLIKKEEERQSRSIELIASENYTSISVLQANSSILTNKYSEGYPGKRYYGGTQVIDEIESLCINRALDLFKLDKNDWGVNVQTLSGSPANFAVYTALIGPNGKLMGLDLPSGGHLTHGYQTKSKKISATSLYFDSMAYTLDENNLLNYEMIETKVHSFKPDIFICGASAYPRDFDYKNLATICNSNNCYLMADISHISGFVACNQMNNPFEDCDIVTMTTHKTLRGPRGALIFYKKNKLLNGINIDIEEKINSAVFPGLQGGPHNQTIAAIAVALKQAMSVEYRNYINLVKTNASYMAELLIKKGYDVITNGTDCHLLLIDMSKTGLTGSMIEKLFEFVDITLNKNAIPNSKSVLNPKGVRIGSSALTTRGFTKDEFKTIITIFDILIKLGVEIFQSLEDKNLENFLINLSRSEKILDVKTMVNNLALKHPIPIFKFEYN